MIVPARKPVIYVARDIERALGINPHAGYRIITNKTPYSESIKSRYPDYVTLVDAGGEILDTAALIKRPETVALASSNNYSIMVFKNNPLIENAAAEIGVDILNPKSSIADKIENKISQVEWLGEVGNTYLPPHKICTGSDIAWSGKPIIVQWAHGHTGDSTVLVKDQKKVDELRSEFPKRMARVTSYISGPSFTVNAISTGDRTLMGNINYQITGLSPFTENAFSTVGNDWSLAHSMLSEKEIETIQTMIGEIGILMQNAGWRGLFGVDFMRDDTMNRIYLIEINARQPAGSVFESFLQSENRKQGMHGLTIFEAHLNSLLGETIALPLVEINDGAQIVQRICGKMNSVNAESIASLQKAGYKVVTYENTDPNSDLIRVQSLKGIMEGHMKLNKRGEEILKMINKV